MVVMSSGYPNLAGPLPTRPGAKRPPNGWDVVLSIVLLIVSVIGWIAAAGMEFFVLAFTDNCPAATCSADKAFLSIAVALSAAAAFVVIGGVLAIISILRRRLGWPFAAATLALSVVAEVLGFVGYMVAVGY
jgi:hypothetical protein